MAGSADPVRCASRWRGPTSGWAARLLIAGLLMSTACGYKVATRNRTPLPVTRVAVEPLINLTPTFEVEQLFTRALVRALVEGSAYRVVSDPAKAEAVLRGEITQMLANPVTFGTAAFGSTFVVVLRARIRLEERETGKVLFQRDDFIFREQYVINIDVRNFFSEENPALERVGRDFAASVVASLVENF